MSDEDMMEFEERSAIMEYDGGLSRNEAEMQAMEWIWTRSQR